MKGEGEMKGTGTLVLTDQKLYTWKHLLRNQVFIKGLNEYIFPTEVKQNFH